MLQFKIYQNNIENYKVSFTLVRCTENFLSWIYMYFSKCTKCLDHFVNIIFDKYTSLSAQELYVNKEIIVYYIDKSTAKAPKHRG